MPLCGRRSSQRFFFWNIRFLRHNSAEACSAFRFIDQSEIGPRRRTVPLLLLLRQEIDAFLESLSVGDVTIPEAFVAQVGVQCDEEVVVLDILYRPQRGGEITMILREAFGHVLEDVRADVLPAVEPLVRDHTLDVKETVLPDGIGVYRPAVILADKGLRYIILAETPKDLAVIEIPFHDVAPELLPTDDDGRIQDDQDVWCGIAVGLGLLAH